jgi:hypothetical protein
VDGDLREILDKQVFWLIVTGLSHLLPAFAGESMIPGVFASS